VEAIHRARSFGGDATVLADYALTTTTGLVTTWMGDCLQAGKPSGYVTSHLGQLSLPSLWGR